MDFWKGRGGVFYWLFRAPTCFQGFGTSRPGLSELHWFMAA